MTLITDFISLIINWMYSKVSALQDDWTRRSVGFIVFILMIFIALIGCAIELIVLCTISVFKTLLEYFSSAKDDVLEFFERYINLW